MLNKKGSYARFFLAGFLTGFSISFPYLIPLFLLGHYLFIKGILTNKKFYLYNMIPGWIFGFGFFLSSMHWIINPFLIYEKHLILAPFILLLFPFLMGTFYSIASVLITRFVQTYAINNSFFFFEMFCNFRISFRNGIFKILYFWRFTI